MSPEPARLPDGTVLEGRYRVDGVLAAGGMSTVHHGMDLRLERPVAIKVMDPALARDPAFVRRFEREARAAARLAHPGIVAVHDQGRDRDGTTFLVLELVEGGTLRDVLRDQGRLDPAVALTVAEQVATALGVAHGRGLVHRDVKPENVLVPSGGGTVKVADFGLVAPGGAGPDTGTEQGGLLGTAAYLAPEQVADGRSDERSDLYSLGVVVFELLTGRPPHRGATAAETARAHVDQDVLAPSHFVGGVPKALDRLVLCLTDRRPDRRPADTHAFLALAREVRGDTDLPFATVPAPPLRRVTDPAHHPWTGTRRLDDSDAGRTRVEPHDGRTRVASGSTPRTARDRRGGTDRRRGSWDDEEHDDGFGGDRFDGDRFDGELDDGPPRSRARAQSAIDVDDRIERLERRRSRTRSRRWFAAWSVAVTAATAAAGIYGWALGLPG